MILEYNTNRLVELTGSQLQNNFGIYEDVTPFLDQTLDRCNRCFSRINNKYYNDNTNNVILSPFHSGQYSIYLYYLANTVYKESRDHKLASKIYYLNKIMNSVDWYYEIELPDYWGVEHPLSSVLGRAKYSNGLFIYQGCTVGGNHGKYPELGQNVILYANVSVLGDAKIGSNVILSTDTIVVGEDIPDNSLVFGRSPNLIIKTKSKKHMKDHIRRFFRI